MNPRRPSSDAGPELYMIVQRGRPIVVSVKKPTPVKIFAVAENHEDAVKLAHWHEWFAGVKGGRPALIGAVQGETLISMLQTTVLDVGADRVVCVRGWAADGFPRWKQLVPHGPALTDWHWENIGIRPGD